MTDRPPPSINGLNLATLQIGRSSTAGINIGIFLVEKSTQATLPIENAPPVPFYFLPQCLAFLLNVKLPEGMGLVCLLSCGAPAPRMVLGTQERSINIC